MHHTFPSPFSKEWSFDGLDGQADLTNYFTLVIISASYCSVVLWALVQSSSSELKRQEIGMQGSAVNLSQCGIVFVLLTIDHITLKQNVQQC